MTISQIGDTVQYNNGSVQMKADLVATVPVDPVSGAPQTGLPPGRAAAASSVPVALSNEDLAAVLPGKTTANRSLATSTTAAQAMAANTARRGWKVKNDSAIDVWINFAATATAAAGSGNMKVAAGAYLASEPGYVETGAMSIIAASGTPAITIYEFS